MQRNIRNRLFEEKLPLINQTIQKYSWMLQLYHLCREDVWQELGLCMLESLERYDAGLCPNLDAYLVMQLRYALLHQAAPSRRYGIAGAPKGRLLQVVSLEDYHIDPYHLTGSEELYALQETVAALPDAQRAAVYGLLYGENIRSSNKNLQAARLRLHKSGFTKRLTIKNKGA